jgi:hypothetical protein
MMSLIECMQSLEAFSDLPSGDEELQPHIPKCMLLRVKSPWLAGISYHNSLDNGQFEVRFPVATEND